MGNTSTTQCTKVKNLITKFYYRDNHLCFQILIKCEADQTIVYREYTDYNLYKKEYDQLLQAKTNNQMVMVPQSGDVQTHMSFV